MEGSYLAWLGAIPLFLAPAFAAGFAMQQFLEGVDACILWLGRAWGPWAEGHAGSPFGYLVNGINQTYANKETVYVKKAWLGLIGFVTALGVVWSLRLFLVHDLINIGSTVAAGLAGQGVVSPFQRYTGSAVGPWAPEDLGDRFVTALIVVAGTSFFNELLKWLEAAKELKQAWASTQEAEAAKVEEAVPTDVKVFVPKSRRRAA